MKLSIQVKVGLVTLCALLILGSMIVWKGELFIKASGYEIIGSFNNVGGLIIGSEVRYRGYKVGSVSNLDPNPKDIKVGLHLGSNVKIPVGSKLRIAFDGLIGQKYVEILPSKNIEVIKKGSELKGINTLGIVDFIDIGTKNLEESKKILEAVSNVTDDPDVQKAAKDILINIEQTTDQLNRIVSGFSGALEKGGFEDLVKSLSLASETIGKVSQRFDSLITGVEKLASDKQFLNDIKNTAKNANEAFSELKKASQTANKLMQKYSR